MDNKKRICIIIGKEPPTAEVLKSLEKLGTVEIITKADAAARGLMPTIPAAQGEIPFGRVPLVIHAPPPPSLLTSPLSYLSSNRKRRRRGDAGWRNKR